MCCVYNIPEHWWGNWKLSSQIIYHHRLRRILFIPCFYNVCVISIFEYFYAKNDKSFQSNHQNATHILNLKCHMLILTHITNKEVFESIWIGADKNVSYDMITKHFMVTFVFSLADFYTIAASFPALWEET